MKELTLVIHHSETHNHLNWVNADAIRGWHLKRGFSDIGYNYIICRDGSIEAGRLLGQKGAHALGFNKVNVGSICFIGMGEKNIKKLPTFENSFLTIAQKKAWRILKNRIKKGYIIKEIIGHYETYERRGKVAEKTCPGFLVGGM